MHGPVFLFKFYLIIIYKYFCQVYTINTNNQKNLMWSTSGNKGDKWNYANVLVGDNTRYMVMFEVTGGSQGRTDVAIDDVSFTPECATGRKFELSLVLISFCDRWFSSRGHLIDLK